MTNGEELMTGKGNIKDMVKLLFIACDSKYSYFIYITIIISYKLRG